MSYVYYILAFLYHLLCNFHCQNKDMLSKPHFHFQNHTFTFRTALSLSAAHHNAPPVHLPLPPALSPLPPPLPVKRRVQRDEPTQPRPAQRPAATVEQPAENFLHRGSPLLRDDRTCIHDGGAGEHHYNYCEPSYNK